MTSTNHQNTMPFAGSRRKTCCGKLSGCACRRSDRDNANTPNHFSGNFSFSQNIKTFYGFNKCGNTRCKIKCTENSFVLPLNNVKCSVNNRGFMIRTNENLNCLSMNVIYLVTCRVCNMQYVGETSRAANVRWYEHLYKIRKGDSGQLIYTHFNCDDAHKNVPIERRLRFQIIEKVKVDDLSSSDSNSIRKRRIERELFWISKLRTAYPLGLNDKISGLGLHGNLTDSRFVDYNIYRVENVCEVPQAKIRRNRHKKKKRRSITNEDLARFKADLVSDMALSVVEKLIYSKQRVFLERFVSSPHFVDLDRKTRYLIRSRVDYHRKVRPAKKHIEQIQWTVDFSHKIMGDVNVNSIMGGLNVKRSLPASIRDKIDIKVFYRYGRTIGGKILNYNDNLRNCGDLSYADILNMQCDCDDSPFKNEHFGHVITGNLEIVEDPSLRELCSFGTKFRENPILNIHSITEKFKNEVDSLVTKLSRKFRLSRGSFKEWKKLLLSNFRFKLLACKHKYNYKGSVLSRSQSKLELDRLRDKYIITVVDKAAGNFAFTCKKLYYLKLATELGLDNISPGNETYCYVQESEEVIIDRTKTDLLRFRLVPDIKEGRLALLYQTPKFHKNPPKMRYIAGNINTVTAKLDKIVASVLKMCKLHFKNLCTKNMGYSGIRYFFDVQTSVEVKDMFSSAEGLADQISINDFSTLYTLFDHDHLLRNITWLLDKLAKNSGMNFVRVGYDKAWWVIDDSEGLVYSVMELIEMIDYLVRNTYIKALGSIFRQDRGIIMGGKSSGWLSDCSLMVDEFRYVDSKVKAGLVSDANRLKFFRRYRDDCTSLNIDNFLAIASDIYPPSLSLTQENDQIDKANVLDMEVKIIDSIITTKVFCKADIFPFNVITLPFLDSNLDTRICYRVFYGQIVRFQRLCSLRKDFEERSKFLLDILVDRGYNRGLLRREFCKAVEKYMGEFQKWVLPVNLRDWFDTLSNLNSDLSLQDSINLSQN